MQKKISLFFLHFRVQESSAEPELRNILQIFVNERQKKDRQQVLVSAVSLFDSVKAVARILHSSFSEGAVAHAACGAEGGQRRRDDACDDLEDGLPRFLVVLHGVCFFRGLLFFEGGGEVSRRVECGGWSFFSRRVECGVWSEITPTTEKSSADSALEHFSLLTPHSSLPEPPPPSSKALSSKTLSSSRAPAPDQDSAPPSLSATARC